MHINPGRYGHVAGCALLAGALAMWGCEDQVVEADPDTDDIAAMATDSAKNAPHMIFELDFNNFSQTNFAGIISDTDTDSAWDSSGAGNTDTDSQLKSAPASSSMSERRDSDRAYQDYRRQVPDGFLMTVPDEVNGQDGVYFTMLNTDTSNDQWQPYSFSQTPLPSRENGLVAAIYPDNGTITTIDGRGALTVHATAVYNAADDAAAPWFPMIEFSLPFNTEIDMSTEDYWYAFEIYLSSSANDLHPLVQFGLYDENQEDWIYSRWYGEWFPTSPVGGPANQPYPNDFAQTPEWVELSSRIAASSTDITWTSMTDDPEEWQFKYFRIRLSLRDLDLGQPTELCDYQNKCDDPYNYQEALFYIGSIRIWQE